MPHQGRNHGKSRVILARIGQPVLSPERKRLRSRYTMASSEAILQTIFRNSRPSVPPNVSRPPSRSCSHGATDYPKFSSLVSYYASNVRIPTWSSSSHPMDICTRRSSCVLLSLLVFVFCVCSLFCFFFSSVVVV